MVGSRYRIGIAGATGLVGQRLVRLLEDHPWFEIAALCASERSAGKRYAEAARWVLPGALPAAVADCVVRPTSVAELSRCDLVFSALDAAFARELEPELRAAGIPVVSNSSAFRMDEGVPLIVPEVNAAHAALVEPQVARHRGGFIVTNPNCSTTGLVVALAPLHREFGVRRVVVATLQAVSGAGIEGPRALELLDNVIPFIGGEEEKIEHEVGKILGREARTRIEPAAIEVSAHCHRVATIDGHLEAVSVELETPADPEHAGRVLAEFAGDVRGLGLPSAPPRPIELRLEPDRPQPRLDRDAGSGMTVVVGRVRPCPVLGLKLELLSHNAVRGAAGGTLLNAELLVARGLVARRAGAA